MDQTASLRRVVAMVVAAALLALLTVASVAAPVAAARPTCGNQAATIVGTNQGETIRGTARDDIIVARGGNDIVRGRGGKDRICGGGGRDLLYGNGGRDRLYGDAGNDRLDGGAGIDVCRQGSGSGRLVSCESTSTAPPPAPAPAPDPAPAPAPTPAPTPEPTPTIGQLVIGGSGSGQVAAAFWAVVGSGGPGSWNTSDGTCYTGRINYGASGIDEYRFAMEFPLSALPAGSTIVRAVLSISALSSAPTQSLHGYPGNGNVSAADATAVGPSLGFDAAGPGYQALDVSSLVTSAMVTGGWAGFLQTRGDYPDATWACRATDAGHPKLTIDYTLP